MAEQKGLTPFRILLAIVIGVAISIAFVFVFTPHPVIVPTQTITPIPTPPPVVIGSEPKQDVAELTTCGNGAAGGFGDIIPIVIIGIGLFMIIVVAFGGAGSEGVLGIIIAMGGILIALYIMAVVMGTIACSVVVSP